MGNSLSSYTAGRNNNFNLIRFIAATLVLYSHSFPLSLGPHGGKPLLTPPGLSWGELAVDVFFITSGFLITGSFFSRKNIIAFLWARILRIYPALVIAILFCVFIVGLHFTTLSPQEYWQNEQTHEYLIKNSTLIFGVRYQLPGVFSDLPWKEAVNGSIWTLPYEIRMYFYLTAVLWLVANLRNLFKAVDFKAVLLTLSVGALSLYIFKHLQEGHSGNATRLFAMFFTGACYYVWQDRIILSKRFFFLALFLLAASLLNNDLFFVAYCLTLPFIIFYIAYIPSGKILNFNKAGDYSYGMYIYAFPVQQSIAATIPGITTGAMVATAFPITFLLAFLSWNLVEKRALKMKGGFFHFERLLVKIGLSKRIWTPPGDWEPVTGYDRSLLPPDRKKHRPET